MINLRTTLVSGNLIFIALFSPVVCHTASHGTTVGKLEITQAWIRATPPNAKNAGAFMIISNHGTAADRLVAVSSEIANKTELHNHINDEGVMRMREVSHIVIPAHSSTELKPGSYHIMFKGLTKAIKEGDMVMINLKFENAGITTLHTPIKKYKSGSKHKHN
tara:strand:+ start:402 stop:890 length:489 start_codon:yes stop_codon:yes gene_type:complete